MSKIRIVFDGPPGPDSGRFVEVEDEQGRSINAGTWSAREDGLWELRISGVDLAIMKANACPAEEEGMASHERSDML